MKIPGEFKNCVVFIEKKKDGDQLSSSTGYVLSININKRDSYIYPDIHVVVTCRHCIKDGNQVSLHYNSQHGKKSIDSIITQWTYSETADLAFAVIGNLEDASYTRIPDSMCLGKNNLDSNGLGEGDQIFMPGMFSSYTGYKLNIPVYQFGHLACISSELSHYIASMYGIEGYSGSPVFIRSNSPQENTSNVWWIGHVFSYYSHSNNNNKYHSGFSNILPSETILNFITNSDTFKQKVTEIKNQYPTLYSS